MFSVTSKSSRLEVNINVSRNPLIMHGNSLEAEALCLNHQRFVEV